MGPLACPSSKWFRCPPHSSWWSCEQKFRTVFDIFLPDSSPNVRMSDVRGSFRGIFCKEPSNHTGRLRIGDLSECGCATDFSLVPVSTSITGFAPPAPRSAFSVHNAICGERSSKHQTCVCLLSISYADRFHRMGHINAYRSPVHQDHLTDHRPAHRPTFPVGPVHDMSGYQLDACSAGDSEELKHNHAPVPVRSPPPQVLVSIHTCTLYPPSLAHETSSRTTAGQRANFIALDSQPIFRGFLDQTLMRRT